MDGLEFRIDAFANDEWERSRYHSRGGDSWWRRKLRFGSAPSARHLPMLACVAVVALGAYVVLVKSAPRLNGAPIAGSRILMVQDDSSSLGLVTDEVSRQISILRNSLDPQISKVEGFGTLSTGRDNLRTVLEEKLPQMRGFDAVYVVSDFYPTDRGVDCDDAAGLERVRELIRHSGVRLYLSTVRMMPSPALLAIARESGGGLIGVQSPQDSASAQASVCGPG
jgi:hypothetical protein